MNEELYEDMLMDELSGEEVDRARRWARAHGCMLITPQDHWVLRERLNYAVAIATEDANPVAAGEAIECLLNDFEKELSARLH
jgi:hypothetical protein